MHVQGNGDDYRARSKLTAIEPRDHHIVTTLESQSAAGRAISERVGKGVR